jgi:hypothetical protein
LLVPVTRTSVFLAATLLSVGLSGAGAARGLPFDRDGAVDQLPNLVPLKPFNIELGDRDVGAGRAIRLAVTTANRGRYPLDVTAVPDAGFPQTADAYQCVAWVTERVCQERRIVGTFVFHSHPSHNHYHFIDFALYELRHLDENRLPDMSPGGLVAPGVKASFCLIDSHRDEGSAPPHPAYSMAYPLYFSCAATGAGVQGISPGWADTYRRGTEGQQIPIEVVPDGDYAVVVISDPKNHLAEASEDDNVAFQRIRLRGTVLTPIAS